MFRLYLRLTGIVILLVVAGWLTINDTQAAATDLFISEYVEGSNGTFNNQAIEIYNGTGATVNLTGYSLERYANAVAGSPTATFNLTGTLASGDVYVVARSSAVPEILAVADAVNDAITSFDGNDVLVLRKSSAGNIDVIGQIGFNPGIEWGTGLTSTQDNTLVRKPAICQGDNNSSDAFDPAVEWIGFLSDTIADLGSHTSDCLTGNTATPTSTSTNTSVPPTMTPTEAESTVTPTATDTSSEETPTATVEVTGTFETPAGTPTSTDTFEETPTSTATDDPSVTGTPTATEQTPGVELLINGGMELDENANKVPDGWKGKNKTGEKIKCDKPEKPVARTGNCAFLFKGGPNEKSKLTQKVVLDGLNFALGDELNLSLYARAAKSAVKGKVKLRIKYADTPKSKANADFARTNGYEEITGHVTIASLNIVAIKVQFDHRSPSGKLFIDDVSLKWVSSLR